MPLLEQWLLDTSTEAASDEGWVSALAGGIGDAGDWARPGFFGGIGGGFPLSTLDMVGDFIPGDTGLRGLETFKGFGE